MEGTPQEPINMQPEPEQLLEKVPMDTLSVVLKLGEKYKITGGKYKKYKVGSLTKINKTYSDVLVAEDAVMLATGNVNKELSVKVKNCYLFPVDAPGIDMPEADNLMVVEDLKKYLEENPDEEFKGTPEINELNEVVDNITDILPSIDEALQLRQDVINLKEEINVLKQEQLNMANNTLCGGMTDQQKFILIKLISNC